MFLRAIALCIGALGLINLLIGQWLWGFDANIWWIDLRAFGPILASLVIVASCAALVLFGYRPPAGRAVRIAAAIALLPLALGAVANAFIFFFVRARGEIETAFPAPLSFAVAVVLALSIRKLLDHNPDLRPMRALPAALVAAGFAAGFPLLQIACFGTTNYARAADVAIVFGAHTYADGTPSDALGDRVVTACDLYRRGLVKRLIFSGGPGDVAIDEPHAMRTMALTLGVPADAIELDPYGTSTAATVQNTSRALRRAERGFWSSATFSTFRGSSWPISMQGWRSTRCRRRRGGC